MQRMMSLPTIQARRRVVPLMLMFLLTISVPRCVQGVPAKIKKQRRQRKDDGGGDLPKSDRYVPTTNEEEEEEDDQFLYGDENMDPEERFQLELETNKAKVQAKLEDAIRRSTTSAEGSVTITSNFIQDSKLLYELSNFTLWEEFASSDAIWLDWNATPTTIWEELAILIWQDYPLVKQQYENENENLYFIGYEIWCNILRPERYDPFPLEWHMDKDENSYQYNLESLKQPIMGAVYYGYPHVIEGGYLEILPQRDAADVPTYLGLRDQGLYRYFYSLLEKQQRDYEIERIQPQYNRRVWFNVSKFHRVAPIKSGFRHALAVNIWRDKKTRATRNQNQNKNKNQQGDDDDDDDQDHDAATKKKNDEL